MFDGSVVCHTIMLSLIAFDTIKSEQLSFDSFERGTALQLLLKQKGAYVICLLGYLK